MTLSLDQIKDLTSSFPALIAQGDELYKGLEKIQKYLELRAQWAKIHNLSGPQALLDNRNDLLDSFALYSVLKTEHIVVDIGTGSGVPGMILACLCPSLTIALVEPLVKRTAFLNTCAYQLNLKNIKVFRERWPCQELLKRNEPLQLVSRAVISPEEWPMLANTNQTSSIYQYLAMNRPSWPLEAFELKAELSYESTEASRLIRRWDRKASILPEG